MLLAGEIYGLFAVASYVSFIRCLLIWSLTPSLEVEDVLASVIVEFQATSASLCKLSLLQAWATANSLETWMSTNNRQSTRSHSIFQIMLPLCQNIEVYERKKKTSKIDPHPESCGFCFCAIVCWFSHLEISVEMIQTREDQLTFTDYPTKKRDGPQSIGWRDCRAWIIKRSECFRNDVRTKYLPFRRPL